MPGWEIVDYASSTKIDSPSGTAYEIANRLSGIGKPENTVPDSKINGPPECSVNQIISAAGNHNHIYAGDYRHDS